MPIINVLLIDDEERFLNTTKVLLEKEGCRVFTAADGWQGVDQLKSRCIDVVVLDVKMPGIDGIDVLRRIKELVPQVEVIMLTGHSALDTAMRGLKLGAFDYLAKPCDINELKLKIKAAHERRSATLDKMQKPTAHRAIDRPGDTCAKE